MVSFGDAVSRYYKNYFNFEGRASRAEYWWPVLMQLIVYFGLTVAFILLVGPQADAGESGSSGGAVSILIAGILFLFFNFIPSLSVAARRFHDLDQTGWLVLVFFIVNFFVFFAGIAQAIWFAFPGTDGPNKYGPDPYGYDADIFG